MDVAIQATVGSLLGYAIFTAALKAYATWRNPSEPTSQSVRDVLCVIDRSLFAAPRATSKESPLTLLAPTRTPDPDFIDDGSRGWEWYRGRVIVLSGTIAAGKTSSGRALEKLLRSKGIAAVFLPEEPNQRMLAAFYAAPRAMATIFQFEMLSRCREACSKARMLAADGTCVIMDRSVVGNLVFAAANAAGYAPSIDAASFELYMDLLLEYASFSFDAIVHLDVPPDVAWHRAMDRGTKCERQGLSLGYMAQLDRIDAYVMALNHFQHNGRVISVDATNVRTDADERALVLTQAIDRMRSRTYHDGACYASLDDFVARTCQATTSNELHPRDMPHDMVDRPLTTLHDLFATGNERAVARSFHSGVCM